MPIPSKSNHWLNSLQARLTILAIGIIVSLGLISNIYVQYQTAELTREIEAEGNAIAQEMAASGSDLLARADSAALQQALDEVVASEELMDLIVVDDQGVVVAKREQARLDKEGEAIQATIGQPGGEDALWVAKSGVQKIVRGPETYSIILPILRPSPSGQTEGKALGAVLVRMSMHDIVVQNRMENNERAWFRLLLLLMMGGFFVPLTYKWVIQPLNQITRATQAIAAGQFETRLPTGGAGEISSLAVAFNQMAHDLQMGQADTQLHLKEMQILHEISVTTSRTLNLDQILSSLTGQLAQLMDASACAIVICDEETKVPRFRSAHGLDLTAENQRLFSAVESFMLSSVIETGQPIFLAEGFGPRGPFSNLPLPAPYLCLLGLPLIVNNHTIGIVIIADTRPPRPVSEHQMQVAMSGIGQVAATIANSSLFVELDAERNRLNEILNASSDAIIVTDMQGMTLYVNPAFTALTGQELETVQQQPPWSFLAVAESELAAMRAEIRTSLTQGGCWRREVIVKRPDGKTSDVDMAISTIRDREKQLVGFVGSLRDISELKELDRMKNRFVSTVSHELRTPLSVINLYTENLLEFYTQLDDTQRRELLNDIHTETRTLHQLIEDLLSLSRLDSGRAEPRRKDFDLNELLVESIISARRLADEKHQEMAYYLPERPAPVYADSDQLAQVFRNLLSNAVKFTPENGHVQMDVEVWEQQVIVRIQDTGIGIPAADLTRLFERFFRSELSVQQEIPGTGLGLAISREIIQRHQGSITVQSEVGKGSTFSVVLPLARANQPTIILIDDPTPTGKP